MRHPIRLSLALASTVALGFFSAACSGPDTPAPVPDPTLTSIQAEIFTPSCTFSSCHSSGAAAGGLVLESGTSFGKLVNVAAEQSLAASQGLLRVKPGDPTNSFLMIKLNATFNMGYGDHMPDTGQQLSAAQLSAISQWITLGAQND